MSSSLFTVDPLDPRAPSREVWASLSEAERRVVLDALPSEIPSTSPPEGDRHRLPKTKALEALGEYFRRMKRRVYLSSELPVYYPEERMFAPDIIAVLDVEPGPRDRWVVDDERKGLDFVMEVAVRGDARKDLIGNVRRYARLAIPEYFAYEPLLQRLSGFRLEPNGTYAPIIPQGGHWESKVLGLGLSTENGRVRFFHGTAPLPEADELIERLDRMINDVFLREQLLAAELEQERERAERESERAEHERAQAERYKRMLRELGVDPDALQDPAESGPARTK